MEYRTGCKKKPQGENVRPPQRSRGAVAFFFCGGALLEGVAALDGERLAGDECGGVGGEEAYGAAHVLGRSDVSHGDAGAVGIEYGIGGSGGGFRGGSAR